jgi:hypothetical protein
MTAPSETPDIAETASFLRRFADLMSNGYNAKYLHRAAELLENLSVHTAAAADEEQLWRYKYETAIRHADELEAECEALKQDIDGHLDLATSILGERDVLRATLEEREVEFAELDAALDRERTESAAKWDEYEAEFALLRATLDAERAALQAALAARDEELTPLRRELEREREGGAAKSKASEDDLYELRLGYERERNELQAQLKVREDELAALRVVSDREHAALRAKVAALEADGAELRASIERSGDLRIQSTHQGGADAKPALEAAASLLAARPADRYPGFGEADAVVPKNVLHQVRAQFEFLAKECIARGDIASQVMCELGAHAIERALTGEQADHLPVGEIALNILVPPDSTVSASPGTM